MDKKRDNGIAGIVRSNLFAILLFIAIAAMMIVGLRNTEGTRKEQAIQSATDSIRRAIITCYAIEGSYPESFEYIKENYGVYINEDEFKVFYSVYGSNMMPGFTVVER